jgi:hypothetical protein
MTLPEAITFVETNLPGWWWKVGTCYLSDDAAIGPDYNHPKHRERLLREFPPEIFDHGQFDVDMRPPGDLGGALIAAYDLAMDAITKHQLDILP